MSPEINPAAPHHLPVFVTAPGETDVLFNVMAIFLVVMVLVVIILYFRLHALPERIAHSGQKIQFELVAVLALISLFTHNHLFWIAGLLLAFIPFPDFTTPLTAMADSLARIAGRGRRAPRDEVPAAAAPEQSVASDSPATVIAAPAKPAPEFQRHLQNGPLTVPAGDMPAADVASTGDATRWHAAPKERA
jgi:hypothetical protein